MIYVRHVVGWGAYNLHDIPHASRLRCVLHSSLNNGIKRQVRIYLIHLICLIYLICLLICLFCPIYKEVCPPHEGSLPKRLD